MMCDWLQNNKGTSENNWVENKMDESKMDG